MKVAILVASSADVLEKAIEDFIADDVTVHSLAFAIAPDGEREAVLLYSDGATPEVPEAVKAWLTDVLADRKAS